MLIIEDMAAYNEAYKFAQDTEQLDSLNQQLEYLAKYSCHDESPDQTRCLLFGDWAPYSFTFIMQKRNPKTGEFEYWFYGRCTYHGPHDNGGDGGAPTFSVCLTPTTGWSIHT